MSARRRRNDRARDDGRSRESEPETFDDPALDSLSHGFGDFIAYIFGIEETDEEDEGGDVEEDDDDDDDDDDDYDDDEDDW
jgi:hypothetical protein